MSVCECVEESCVNVCDCQCVNLTTLVVTTLVGVDMRVITSVCVCVCMFEGGAFLL